MRSVFAVGTLLLCLLSGGCAIYEKEVSNRGGYLDYLADEYWLKAESKKMRAVRALAIEVSLVRIASVSQKTVQDREILARQIGSTTKRGTYVFECAFAKNPLGDAFENPCFYYDSLMVDYSTALFDLAMMALPREDGRKLLDAIGGNILNPLNVGGVIESLLNIGRDAIKYGRITGALYRDTLEMEVQMWLASPNEPVGDLPATYQVTADKVATLRALYNRNNDDIVAWRTEINALRAQGLEPIPSFKFFAELAAILRYQCGQLTTGSVSECSAGFSDKLKKVAETAGVPLAQRAGAIFVAQAKTKNSQRDGARQGSPTAGRVPIVSNLSRSPESGL